MTSAKAQNSKETYTTESVRNTTEYVIMILFYLFALFYDEEIVYCYAMLDLHLLRDEIIMAPAEPTIPLNTGYISDYPRHPSLKRLQQNFGAHPPTQFESLQHLGKCHTESFNFMLTDGLKLAIEDLERVEFLIPETGARVGE